MIQIASYLLKMVICSGILFLYYHLALRNKLFHQWNRFYLIIAVILSITVPLVQIQLDHSKNEVNTPAQVINAVQSATMYLDNVVVSSAPATSPIDWILPIYLLVSILLLASLLLSIYKVVRIICNHSVMVVEEIKFVNTKVPGTPFSFFNYILWNQHIPLQSETGQRIFEHELIHVKEKHSVDKLLMQLVLVLFWMNPFFWLIWKEIKMIHEFLADKKAVGAHGTAAFAEMILQSSYKSHYNTLTNPFFHTSIKRRLKMLNKINNPKISYISRIVALPIIAFVILAFSFKGKEKIEYNDVVSKSSDNKYSKIESPNVIDTIPKQSYKGNEIYQSNIDFQTKTLVLTFANGRKETITFEEARKAGLKLSIPNVTTDGNTNVPPLYIVNGKEFNGNVSQLNPNAIDTINVLKGVAAKEKYGDKAKHGVIEVTLKQRKDDELILDIRQDSTLRTDLKLEEVVVQGFPLPKEEDKNIIFTKTEHPASIDPVVWNSFLEKNVQLLVREVGKTANAGKYTVPVRFIVETDGSISEIKALSDPGYGIATQVEKFFSSSPKWKPAIQNGKVVRSYHQQPITIIIDGGSISNSNNTKFSPTTIKNYSLHELAGVSSSDEIISCTLSIDSDNGKILEVVNTGNSLSDKAKELLNTASPGKILTLDAIVAKVNGATKKLVAKVYRM